MKQASVFKSNQSQAVRLPKAVSFPEHVKQLDVVVVGDARILTPAGSAWDAWFDSGISVSDDFMSERNQPPVQTREVFE